jgi:outer membrane protein assembly factor BamD
MILILGSIRCASFKSNEVGDIDVQFEKARIFLDKKKYLRAQEEFNNLVIRGTHTELGDDSQFYLAESYFLNKEYLLAIAEYDRLIRRMGFSPYVEKSRWRVCQSYVKESPKYYKDQTNTQKALSKLQEFIDDYPNSEYKDEANNQISELRNKLAYKEYATGVLYIKMEEYQSAIMSFEFLIDNYYDTEVLEKGHVGIIRCYALMDEYNKAEDYYNNHLSEIFSNNLKETAQNYIKKSNSSN